MGNTVSNLHVLVIGLDPYRVPGPWNPKPVADAIEIGMTALADRGFHAEACLVGLDGSDDVEARVTAALQARSWDCVIVGGGIRTPEELDASPTTNAFVFGVEEKVTGRLIGHVGLSPLFDTVEVGFGIATSEQRKGYATEGVARVCAWGLERFSIPAIVGVTDKENVSSQRVLIRCGFIRKEKKMMGFQGVDRPVVVFELRRKEPNQSAPANRHPTGHADARVYR